MKRCNKANNLSLGNKMPKPLAVTVLVLSLAMVTGCGKTDNTPTTPSIENNAETSIEAESIPETTEEETVVPTETVPETKDIESIVKNIDLSQYKDVFECIEDLSKYDTLMIVVYADEAKQILLDGDSYTDNEENNLLLNRSPHDVNIKEAYIKTSDGEYKIDHTDEFYFLPDIHSDGLYKIVFEYNDGAEEEMAINFSAK